MKWRSIAIGVVTLSLACVGSARAGVYSTAEPVFQLNEEFPKFLEDTLIPLKRIGIDRVYEEKAEWLRCYSLAGKALKQAKSPPARGEDDPFTVEDRLNMSACLLRMRDPLGAIEVLRPVSWQDPGNFLVMANLGTAYMMAGDYDTAEGWLTAARPIWRKSFADLSSERRYRRNYLQIMRWNERDFAWYARCEKYQLRLAKLRAMELGRKAKFDFERALARLDNLLVDPDKEPPPPGVAPLRFVGESGAFVPGTIAAAEKAKIPQDAMQVVQQLLVWMPEDLRLIWLIGELLNARDDIHSASMVLGEALQRFAKREEFKSFPVNDAKAMLPLFVKRHPEIGNRLVALEEEMAKRLKALDNNAAPPVAAPKQPHVAPPKPPPSGGEVTVNTVKIDWQTLGIGFGAGALVGILLTWWLRENLRRRHARTPVLATPMGAGDGWQRPTGSGTSNIQAE
jgi:tetratricopeptide (TPR) repeat protein